MNAPQTPTPSPAKNASDHVFRRLVHLLGPYRGRIGLGLVLLLMSLPGELFPAFIWLYVVDGLIHPEPGRAVNAVGWLVSFGGRIESKHALLISAITWMAGVYVVFESLETLSSNVLQRTAEAFIRDLRRRVYGKLQGQSLSWLQRQRTGDLMSRSLSDVDELRGFVVGGIDQIVGEGLLWVITVIVVFSIDWRVASVSMAPLVAVYLLLRVFNKKVGPIYKSARDAQGRVSSRLQENLSGVIVIKTFGREQAEAERFDAVTQENLLEQVKSINARTIYFPFTRAVGFLSNVFMIGMSGWLLLSGSSTFTFGKLVMFRSYWYRLFGPVQTLARVNDMVQRAMASCRRIYEVLDAPDDLPDAPDAADLKQVEGHLVLRDIDFAYAGTDAAKSTVLRGVTIDIPAGKTVAIVGPSGAGKSTILNLLLRFYDPTRGVITLDGHDLRQIKRESLRRHSALVQQETFLFNESIGENIRYGHSDATQDQVITAAKAANAHGFISKLPDGYATVAGERGIRLSGGQKQRISLARAFLADPKVLLLDEPTSSVEPDSEAIIVAAIDRLMVGRTTVITTHRPSLVSSADLVYVIENGQVSHSGPVAEVREASSWFDRFMRSAIEDYLVPSPGNPGEG
ncbi:MAG: transporter ATP-binding protein [Phycisphaerales bacterium]|nr:transporter ATP-binding protein [Phycisphaerales bacterium]